MVPNGSKVGFIALSSSLNPEGRPSKSAGENKGLHTAICHLQNSVSLLPLCLGKSPLERHPSSNASLDTHKNIFIISWRWILLVPSNYKDDLSPPPPPSFLNGCIVCDYNNTSAHKMGMQDSVVKNRGCGHLFKETGNTLLATI